jgi:hypothetical protein
MTEFRAWLSIQLFSWAISVCPFEEMRDVLRCAVFTASDAYLNDLEEDD